MNQQQLTDAIAKRFFLSKTESRKIVKFIQSQITASLKKGERVYLRGFGSFTRQEQASRRIRDIKTGKLITIPKRTTIQFAPSRLLLRKIKKGS